MLKTAARHHRSHPPGPHLPDSGGFRDLRRPSSLRPVQPERRPARRLLREEVSLDMLSRRVGVVPARPICAHSFSISTSMRPRFCANSCRLGAEAYFSSAASALTRAACLKYQFARPRTLTTFCMDAHAAGRAATVAAIHRRTSVVASTVAAKLARHPAPRRGRAARDPQAMPAARRRRLRTVPHPPERRSDAERRGPAVHAANGRRRRGGRRRAGGPHGARLDRAMGVPASARRMVTFAGTTPAVRIGAPRRATVRFFDTRQH
jgi:hypothetical protein